MSDKYIKIKTLGELKKSKYVSRSIKEEIRSNLSARLTAGTQSFKGIHGFENSVVPDLERAMLSRHNILLLGLRGQAKTKIARMMTEFLDEYVPVVDGSEINDDPMKPISRFAKDLIKELGDATPISWLHRSDRYVEKLATPDVTVADLIGDVDPIKAAHQKLTYSDERVIHFGLIPRAHRCIFVINELPDLQARIQVSLFNILQEGDMQIRGFKLRLPLDIQFLFTANPEDYTNRGSIVTPLKDRIESQIITHYPGSIEVAKEITLSEAKIAAEQLKKIQIPDLLHDILEAVSFQARESEFIDEKSGVSARVSISAYENLYSSCERRMLLNHEKKAVARISDLWSIIPALTGKLELVYEGEQEGTYSVAYHLIMQVLKDKFSILLPNPNDNKRDQKDPYGTIKAWFAHGNSLELMMNLSEKDYQKDLSSVAGLDTLVSSLKIKDEDHTLYKELILFGLAANDIISQEQIDENVIFTDPLSDIFNDMN